MPSFAKPRTLRFPYNRHSDESAGTPYELQADPLGVLRLKGHRECLPVSLTSIGPDSELDILTLAIVITDDACPARCEPDTDPATEAFLDPAEANIGVDEGLGSVGGHAHPSFDRHQLKRAPAGASPRVGLE
jgi:hypothetical protein